MAYSEDLLRSSLIDKYDYDYHEEDEYDHDAYVEFLSKLNYTELLYEFLDVYGLDEVEEIADHIGYY